MTNNLTHVAFWTGIAMIVSGVFVHAEDATQTTTTDSKPSQAQMDDAAKTPYPYVALSDGSVVRDSHIISPHLLTQEQCLAEADYWLDQYGQGEDNPVDATAKYATIANSYMLASLWGRCQA